MTKRPTPAAAPGSRHARWLPLACLLALAAPPAFASAPSPTPAPGWTPAGEMSSPTDPAKPGEQGDRPTPRYPDVPVLRFARVDEGLYRGGLPSREALKRLAAMGIKTDIDLMGEVPAYDTFYVDRERLWARQAGVRFVQVKVPTGILPHWLLPPISDTVADAFLKVALDPANQPCYVHCLHGRDRTGTMVAVYRMARDHFTNARAFAEMKSFGFEPRDYPSLAAYVQQYHPPTSTSARP